MSAAKSHAGSCARLQAKAAANPARWVTYKEIPNASHQVMQEKADDVCLFIADFLRQLESAYRLEHSLLDASWQRTQEREDE